MTNPTLGIMTVYTPTHPPFPEKAFFKALFQIGQREEIPVIVFYPNQVDFTTRKVRGYSLNDTGNGSELPLRFLHIFMIGVSIQGVVTTETTNRLFQNYFKTSPYNFLALV